MNVDAATQTPIYSTLASDPDLEELVVMFVDEMTERIDKLTALLDSAKWDDLRRAAHQLKGAAGSYGFQEISPMAANVEDKIISGEPEEEIRKAVESLCDLCRCARAGLPE
jgi:histidine phosphotransfer protein HptB